MKIIEPSATIIENELVDLSICQRIDRCASVCYQRPSKPTEEEAEKFCLKLIDSDHLPALEFAVLHLIMDEYCVPESSYLHTNYINGDEVIVSGSLRAFMEADYVQDTANFLSDKYSLFFNGNSTEDASVRFAEVDEIPWQHKHVAVRVVCSRAISHQLVRHRPCSFLQESQRYCRYDDEVVFIRPEWVSAEHFGKQPEFAGWTWESAMESVEFRYQQMLKNDLSPQQARTVLPESTKTEMIIYAILPEWLHIFRMRCSKAADPEMRRIMLPLREQFKVEYPEMWEVEK